MIELFFLVGALTSIVITVFLIGLFTEDSVNKKYSYSEIVKLSKINLIAFAVQATLLFIVVGIVSAYYPSNTALWMLCLFMFGTLILMTLAYNLFKSTRLYKLDTQFRSICKWCYKQKDYRGIWQINLTCFEEISKYPTKSWILVKEGEGGYDERLIITTDFQKIAEIAKTHYTNCEPGTFDYRQTADYFYINRHE